MGIRFVFLLFGFDRLEWEFYIEVDDGVVQVVGVDDVVGQDSVVVQVVVSVDVEWVIFFVVSDFFLFVLMLEVFYQDGIYLVWGSQVSGVL